MTADMGAATFPQISFSYGDYKINKQTCISDRYNILLLLVKNQGKVFSIDQIYESIWNEDAIGVDNTVAVHIRHIREKIEINPKEPRYPVSYTHLDVYKRQSLLTG